MDLFSLSVDQKKFSFTLALGLALATWILAEGMQSEAGNVLRTMNLPLTPQPSPKMSFPWVVPIQSGPQNHYIWSRPESYQQGDAKGNWTYSSQHSQPSPILISQSITNPHIRWG